ncbi:MAG: hypothetical protein U9Q96_02670 [Patescibacteria group bacterium]|nr:hypothetical protein [Patescibacteria group bacterium]
MVGVTIHITLPRVGRRYQVERSKIPSIWESSIVRRSPGETEEGESVEIGILSGESLLVKNLYRSLAADKLFDSNLMAAFFKDATIDGVRARMVERSYTRCREDKTAIEEEVKDYLLTDPANLFVKCGILLENLDVSITSLKSTDEIERSLYAEEVAIIKGSATQREIFALTEAGVDRNIAGILVRGVGKQEGSIDFGAMAQMGIALKFLGIESPTKESLSPDSRNRLTDLLDSVSREEAATMRQILREAGVLA